MRRWLSTICLFLFSYAYAANPFALQLPRIGNRELTNEDYIEIQKQFKQIDVNSLITELYQKECTTGGFTSRDDFYARCSKSVRQTLIDADRGLFPQKAIIQIGSGGDRCIICSVPFDGKYPYYVLTLMHGLIETGFNGYFFYYMGGWPNPTKTEINYVAVPYSFKIFAMVEAHLLGFNKILWVDSACYPLRNVTPLFDLIERDGALLYWYDYPDAWRYIFPSTKDLLLQLTGVDVRNAKFVNGSVLGIKMDTPEAKRFIQKYYEFAEMGTPFLSCFPEEFVVTAIVNDGTYPTWTAYYPPWLAKTSATYAEDSPEEFELLRQKGVFFYNRRGR